MDVPATTFDLSDRWRPLTDAELPVADALLVDAWAELQLKLPSLPSRLDASTLDRALVVRVLCAMVLRVLRNPEGLRSESIGAYSYTRDQALSAGLLYVDPTELALLAPQPVAQGPWAGSVSTAGWSR